VCLLIKYTMLMIQAEEKKANPVKKVITGTHDTIRMIDAVLGPNAFHVNPREQWQNEPRQRS